jgi:hypothetical protein
MIGAAATRPTELLPLRVRLRGVRTIDEEQNEQIINKAGRSTYPDKKSVLRTEATRGSARARLLNPRWTLSAWHP